MAFAFAGCSKKKNTGTSGQASASNAESLQLFHENGEYGYRDAAGTVVIKPQFVEAQDFSWGLAPVKPDAKHGWGYIDASGNEVIHPQYEAAGQFAEGIAVVLNKGQFVYIGPDGESMGSFDEDRSSKPLAAGDTLYVIHPGGLIARASGSLNAAPVARLSPGDFVVAAKDPRPAQFDTFSGLRSRWQYVRCKGTTGYVFDLYLSRYPIATERQPVERYHLVGSTLNSDDYSTYTLTKFVSGGRSIVHNGPDWTEDDEIVPDATVDQVVARMELYPSGEIGPLVAGFNGVTRSYVTDVGDTVTVAIRRDAAGFLEQLSLAKKNEESLFDVTIAKYGASAAKVVTSTTTPPTSASDRAPNEF